MAEGSTPDAFVGRGAHRLGTRIRVVPGSNVLGFAHRAKPVPVVDPELAGSRYFLGDELSFGDFFYAGGSAHWKARRAPLSSAKHLLRGYEQSAALPAWKQRFPETAG